MVEISLLEVQNSVEMLIMWAVFLWDQPSSSGLPYDPRDGVAGNKGCITCLSDRRTVDYSIM
jgi:hypothetical protein